jgi:hypothetical protein
MPEPEPLALAKDPAARAFADWLRMTFGFRPRAVGGHPTLGKE